LRNIIESNAWLVLVTAGLSLDIAGIIILTKPLLRFNLRFYNYLVHEHNRHLEWAESVFNSEEKYKKMQNIKTSWIDFRGALTASLRNQVEQMDYERQFIGNTLIALIIIISGFFLQIIGNIIK